MIMDLLVTSTCNCFEVFAYRFFLFKRGGMYLLYDEKTAESDTVLVQKYLHVKKVPAGS